MSVEDLKGVRWRQRFANLEKAFILFKEAALAEGLNRLEQEGLIQRFEYTWELAWNTLKDFLESQGIVVSFPRDAVREAFAGGLLSDGEVWMEMLSSRNLASHRYDEAVFKRLIVDIRTRYYPALEQLVEDLRSRRDG